VPDTLSGMVRGHLSVVKAQNGKPKYKVYLDRLMDVKAMIEDGEQPEQQPPSFYQNQTKNSFSFLGHDSTRSK